MQNESPNPENGRPSSATAALIVGALCGAAVGAIAGLLLAPKRGVDLRRDVAESMTRFKHQASEAVADVAVRGRRAWHAGREAFTATSPHDDPTAGVGV